MPARRQADDRNRQRLLDEAYCASADGVTPGQYVMIAMSDTGTGMSADVIEQGVRPVLHHKAGRRRHRSRPQPGPRLRQAERRPHPDLQRARRGNHGQGLPAPESCRRPRERRARRRRRKSRREASKRCWWSRTTRRCALSSPRPCAASTTGCWKPPTARQRFRWFADPRRSTCLLTDVVMPGMNGRALGDAAQQHRPGLKILYMTGYSRNAIVHQGRLDPGVSLIQKPFSESALASRVHRDACGGQKLTDIETGAPNLA